jgi:hypothetical protein
LQLGESVQRRWITGGGSYQSVDAARAYFATDKDVPDKARVLRVVWPDGEVTTLERIPLNRRVIVHRDAGKTRTEPLRGRSQ